MLSVRLHLVSTIFLTLFLLSKLVTTETDTDDKENQEKMVPEQNAKGTNKGDIKMLDTDIQPPVKIVTKKKSVWEATWGGLKTTGSILEMFFNVIISLYFIVTAWTSIVDVFDKTVGVLRGEKGDGKKGKKLLQEYLKIIDPPKKAPSSVTESVDPIFDTVKDNLVSVILIFVLVNLFIVGFMWLKRKEQILERRLEAAQVENGIVLVAGGGSVRGKHRKMKKGKRPKRRSRNR